MVIGFAIYQHGTQCRVQKEKYEKKDMAHVVSKVNEFFFGISKYNLKWLVSKRNGLKQEVYAVLKICYMVHEM